MILDTSALVAIVLREAGYESLLDAIGRADIIGVGAPTLAEAGIVLSARLGRDARTDLTGALREVDARVVSFGEEHWHAAVDAFLRFGKGRHRAALNFGDCMTYAVARVAGLPLLFTGADFSRTDIEAAV